MNEQQQARADAILVARKALESRGKAAGPFSAPDTVAPKPIDLIVLANYIVEGVTG